MAELKTKATGASVTKFIAGIKDAQVREDSAALAKVMKQVTKSEPAMWGPSIVGFGRFTYGPKHEREWFLTGFAPRKKNLTLYLMGGLGEHAELMKTLGKYKAKGGCLHVKTMDDVHVPTLKKLIVAAIKRTKERFPAR